MIKIYNSFNNIKNNIFICKILFVLSICYFFSFAFFGLDFTDTFFHLNNARVLNFSDINFLTILSTLIIKFILEFITQDIIGIRILNGIIKILPLFIYFYYFKISNRSFLVWTIITLILVTPNNFFVLGYDSFSIFTLIMILLVLILNKPHLDYRVLVLLSLLSSCAVLIRLPNILVIGIVFFNILFVYGNTNIFLNENFRKACFYLLLTLLFTLSIYYLVYGDLKTLLASNSIMVKSEGHHGVDKLINYYLKDFSKIVFYSVQIILFIWLFLKKHKNYALNTWYLFIIILLHSFFFLKYISFSRYSHNFSIYITAVIIVFILHNFLNKAVNNLKTNAFLIFLLLFLFIEPFGSDTGLLKASPLFIIFPFVYEYSKLKTKNLYFILLVSILPFAIMEKAKSIYQDSTIHKLQYITNIEIINHINTSKERAKFINSIDTEYKILSNNNYAVFFYGKKSQIFKYLYPTFNLGIKDYHQQVDELKYLNQILKVTKKHKKVALFIINDYPSLNCLWNESTLEKELVNNNFKVIIKNNFIYYIK